MKEILTSTKRTIVARIMSGEDIIDSITELVKKYHLTSGKVKVIGALNKFTVGYFDLDSKEYLFKTYNENVELVSCIGNIAYKDNQPIIHLHFIVGRRDYTLLGGHLGQPSIISVTGEVFIDEIETQLTRVNDPGFELSLLDI